MQRPTALNNCLLGLLLLHYERLMVKWNFWAKRVNTVHLITKYNYSDESKYVFFDIQITPMCLLLSNLFISLFNFDKLINIQTLNKIDLWLWNIKFALIVIRKQFLGIWKRSVIPGANFSAVVIDIFFWIERVVKQPLHLPHCIFKYQYYKYVWLASILWNLLVKTSGLRTIT